MATRADLAGILARLEGGQPLDAIYVVAGDEPLLVTEAMDGLRRAAQKAGFTDRTSSVLDARSDWTIVTAASQNVSLFGDKRLLELKIPTGKPGRTGGEVLGQLAASANRPAQDAVVLISLPRLDKTTRGSKWARALESASTWMDIPTIQRSELPQWIGRRLAQQNQQVDRNTLEWMADKVEGNLLAAHQEIQKLGLLYPEGTLAPRDVETAVLNVARYDVFGLREAMLAGQAARALNILAGLQAEGEALPLVLWAIGEEVRLMARLYLLSRQGGDVSAAMRQQRIFGVREQLMRKTLARIPGTVWPAAVQHAHDIDCLIKGLKVPGRLHDPWEELARLVTRIAVTPAPSPRAVA